MAETMTWKVGVKQTFVWTLPVIAADVPQTNVFVDQDGTTQFTDENGQTFRDNNL